MIPIRLARSRRAVFVCTGLVVGTTGCLRVDSFNPVTPQGLEISNLYNLELVISLALFLLITGLVGYSLVRFRRHPGDGDPPQVTGNGKLEIAWTAIPVLVLATMFVLTVRTIHTVNASSRSALPVQVIGHQWWWEFRYPNQGVTTANELHVSVGAPLHLSIESGDVIHSFWVPQFGWMKDAVPGKTNQISVQVDQAGLYDGSCTQFCGLEHAWMRIRVVAESREQFDAWVQQQRQLAATPQSSAAIDGQQVFLRNTCVSCHTISGTSANGRVGPDLTHVGSRATLGAGVLANTPENLRHWVQAAQEVKPGVVMPNFRTLPEDDVRALAAYLGGTALAMATIASPYASPLIGSRGDWLLQWVTTTDHKRIGVLYLLTTAVFFVLGGIEVLLIRVQLAVPRNTFLDPGQYNAVFTVHGTTMVFLVVMPLLLGLPTTSSHCRSAPATWLSRA